MIPPTLIFATHNPHKVREMRTILGENLPIISLEEAGFFEDIPEPHLTLEENAREKSKTIYRKTGKNCFSEDSGLEVNGLHGAPGVHSSRYAGENKSSRENINKLLHQMQNLKNRQARFRTVISLVQEGKEFTFEGICRGSISPNPRGEEGFGYDPVFIPEGSSLTFGEMSLEEKNLFSHRAKALGKFLAFFQTHYLPPN